jgi:hypothetical protein
MHPSIHHAQTKGRAIGNGREGTKNWPLLLWMLVALYQVKSETVVNSVPI